MQAHQARMRARRRQQWLRASQILGFGLVLGLFQLALALGVAAFQQVLPQLLCIALAVILYLLVPALVGYFGARRSSSGASGEGAGCLVGGIGFLIILGALLVSSVFVPHFLQPQCQPDCNPRGAIVGAAIARAAVFLYLLLEGVVAAGAGLLGGWLGGLLGRRHAAAAPRQNAAANNAS